MHGTKPPIKPRKINHQCVRQTKPSHLTNCREYHPGFEFKQHFQSLEEVFNARRRYKTFVTVLPTICCSRWKALCSGNRAKNVLPTPAGAKWDSGIASPGGGGAGFAKLYTLPIFFNSCYFSYITNGIIFTGVAFY